MDLKVGDYVRTKRGYFYKITDLKPFYENDILIKEKQFVYIDNKCSGWYYAQFSELIINSSPDIIDLIQVGDYVNGKEIEQIINNELYFETNDMASIISFKEKDIKSIVTKEQFESMEYRIGEDE